MGHKGIIITDDLGMPEQSGEKPEQSIANAFRNDADISFL